MATSKASSGNSIRLLHLPTASASVMVPASWAVRLNYTSGSEGDAFAMFYHIGDASEEGQGRSVALGREDCVSWQNKLESSRQDDSYGVHVQPAPGVQSWMAGAEAFHASSTLNDFPLHLLCTRERVLLRDPRRCAHRSV
jgi:hypothetical protein